jgi:hypothetical protein
LEFGGIGGIIGQQNASNCRMMNKKTTARVYGITLASPFAILIAALVYAGRPGLHMALIVLLLIALWVVVFITGTWIMKRELPISGAERRRRNKQFYDWLTFPRTPLIFKTARYPNFRNLVSSVPPCYNLDPRRRNNLVVTSVDGC